MNVALVALAVWRRRGDTARDALWSAACWEQSAAELLRVRPRCLTATYRADAEEEQLHAAARKRNRAAVRDGKPTVIPIIPYLHASADLALDLQARRRVEDYLQRADEAIAGDDAAILVIAEEDRQHAVRAPRAPDRTPWPRARRGAWV